MTADSGVMREAASRTASEKKKYETARQEIDTLITSTLAQYWGDEAYDEFKNKYTSKDKNLLIELGQMLDEFVKNLNNAADDLDKRIGSLKGRM